MALLKDILQQDGVMTSYHRILFVQNNPNSHVSVVVASLTTTEARTREKSGEFEHPYTITKTFETTEHDEFTTEQAYDWLKTLDEFSGSEDI